MTLLGRIVVILLALFVASFVAGLVVTAAVLLPEWSDLAVGAFEQGSLAVVATFGAIFISGFALLPALLVVVLAEGLSIRSALFYAAAGAVVGAAIHAGFGGWDLAMLRIDGAARRELEVMAGAGIAAGLIYWLIAGRNAGRWREPPPAGA